MSKRKPLLWKPSPTDYNAVFAEQNPWHQDGVVPGVLAHAAERGLAKTLWRRVSSEPVRFQLILGPRRVGKTTVMYQTVRHLMRAGVAPARLWWLRLDHPLLMRVELGTLVNRIVQATNAQPDKPTYLFLDEVTYAKDWDLWLKTWFDERVPVRVVGTSSATAALRERRMESGVGRWEEQYLAPYLFSEYLELVGVKHDLQARETLQETIDARLACGAGSFDAEHSKRFMLTGGFPELLLNASKSHADMESQLLLSQRVLRSDAVERAIYKDIPQVFGVQNPLLLERLLYTLAGQATGVLSPQSICATLDGMSQPTFDKYVSYLERAYLIFTLQNYSPTEAAKQKRGRKLYFVDGAVRNAALQRGTRPLGDPTELGMLMENLVAGHLHALCQHGQVRLYYWRTNRNEVDLVYDHPEKPIALEVSHGRHHSLAGLWEFRRKHIRFEESLYFASPQTDSKLFEDTSINTVRAVPLDTLLLCISVQAERELTLRLDGTLDRQR